jgi:hypothetical protein
MWMPLHELHYLRERDHPTPATILPPRIGDITPTIGNLRNHGTTSNLHQDHFCIYEERRDGDPSRQKNRKTVISIAMLSTSTGFAPLSNVSAPMSSLRTRSRFLVFERAEEDSRCDGNEVKADQAHLNSRKKRRAPDGHWAKERKGKGHERLPVPVWREGNTLSTTAVCHNFACRLAFSF